ncbi:hypothetical protein GL982_10930 (plasmid) [Spiroplasma citri]|uniref:hypothetical protein n=1 Tax=Spiroplasma citri TaxID=2133 RepID=UPI0013A092FE|nr:hypothetical protein [Spiroplasma citri]QIA74057.1 hypothetical protein GL982_10930 [Spiroplasma citri]
MIFLSTIFLISSLVWQSQKKDVDYYDNNDNSSFLLSLFVKTINNNFVLVLNLGFPSIQTSTKII